MFRSYVIVLLFAFVGIGVCYAQEELSNNSQFSRTGASFKIITAPEVFFQPNLKAPMPTLGFKGSMVLNTTELEIGLTYFPKIFQKDFTEASNYLSILYTYHYFLPSFHIHQKLYAKNKHVLSASLGVALILLNVNFADTLLKDGSHSVRNYPTSPNAYVSTPQIETSFRYSYVFSKNIAFYTAPYFHAKLWNEMVMPNSPLGNPGVNDTYIPETNRFSFGIMLGFHFMFHLSKESPSRFFMDTVKKEK